MPAKSGRRLNRSRHDGVATARIKSPTNGVRRRVSGRSEMIGGPVGHFMTRTRQLLDLTGRDLRLQCGLVAAPPLAAEKLTIMSLHFKIAFASVIVLLLAGTAMPGQAAEASS